MSHYGQDKRVLRCVRALLIEHAERYEQEGRPGSAELVREAATTFIHRMQIRCQEAERLRRDIRAIEQATTERLQQQA